MYGRARIEARGYGAERIARAVRGSDCDVSVVALGMSARSFWSRMSYVVVGRGDGVKKREKGHTIFRPSRDMLHAETQGGSELVIDVVKGKQAGKKLKLVSLVDVLCRSVRS